VFFKANADGTPERAIFPDEDGRLYIPKSNSSSRTYRKPVVLAWEFINNKNLPDDHVVYFKNLDEQDFSAYNLGILHKNEYKHLKDAIDNLNGTLKLIPNTKNPYGIILRYKQNGRVLYKNFDDVVTAKKAKRTMIIRATKFLSKYLVTE
jgi:hypothetical protein